MLNSKLKGVSSVAFTVVIIVVLIVAGAGGYFAGMNSVKAAGATVTTTVTVGSGSAATSTTTQSTTYATSAQSGAAFDTSYLVNQCKTEGGTATVYTVVGSSAFPTIQKYLGQTFPWMKVNLLSFSPGNLVSKANAEYQAGHVSSDVIADTYADWLEVNSTGAIQSFYNPMPYLNNASAINIDPNGYWYQQFYDPIVVIYNTKLVNASQVPTSWQDLASPIWKGKIAMDNPALLNVAGLAFASLEPSMGNATWTQLMKGIAANNPIMTSSAGQTSADVVDGSAALGIVLFDNYHGDISSGAPIAAAPINPFYVLTVTIGLAKDAPQPACGELVVQWFTSYIGQEALQSTARPSYLPYISGPYLASAGLPANATYIPGATGAPSYFTDTSGWSSYYSSIFGAP